MVAETYENRSHVDPDLTEPALYDGYRERTASKLEAHGRLSRSQFNRAIEGLAFEMLEREHFAIPHDVAASRAGGASALDLLISQHIIQPTANYALSPVRFRHGQFRNHTITGLARAGGILPVVWSAGLMRSAAAKAPYSMNSRMWSISPVGLSAAEYAATHDIPTRNALFAELLAIQPSRAIELAQYKGWWENLELGLFGHTLTSDVAYLVAHNLGGKVAEYPKLFDAVVRAIPSHFAFLFSQGTFDSCVSAAWSAIKPYFGQLPLNDSLSLLRSLVIKDVVSGDEAVGLYDTLPSREVANSGSSFDYDYMLYALLPIVLERLDGRAARSFFERTASKFAIANSNSGYNSDSPAIVLGADQSIYSSANIVCRKLSAPQSVAWASRMLIESHVAYLLPYSQAYTGHETVGPGHSQIGNQYSYQDNAWLLKVIVPELKVHLGKMSAAALKSLIGRAPQPISALHPTFRIRATVLALPTKNLDGLASELIGLCDVRGSIPSVADAVATRALESEPLARRYLEWAWKTREMLAQPDEARLLHTLIASRAHGAFASDLARSVVSSKHFAQLEPMQLAFFNQLDWASNNRALALELVQLAVDFGFKPGSWDSSYIIRVLREVVNDEALKVKVMTMPKLAPYLSEAFSAEDFRDPDAAAMIFANADASAKMSLLQKAGGWKTNLAIPLICLGLRDLDPAPDSEVEQRYRKDDASSITGVRVTAYWTLIQHIQRGDLTLSEIVEIGILETIGRETASYAAHHGLILLQVILNVAAREANFDLGIKAIDVASSFLTLHDDRIDEQIAHFITWWWNKVGNTYQELARSRLGGTESFLKMLLGRSLFAGDTGVIEELVSAVPTLSAKRSSWLAWNLWRTLNGESAPSLDSQVVQRLVDLLIQSPETDKYSTLSTLLVERQAEDQHFATTRFFKLIEISAVGYNLSFPI